MVPTVGLARAALVTASIIALALVALLCILTFGTEAQVTEVMITIDEGFEQQITTVTDTRDESLRFPGQVSVDRIFPIPPEVEVHLFAHVSPNPELFSVVFQPANITIEGDGSASFNATVNVPTNLSADTVFTVTFNATVTPLPVYNVIPGYGYMTVEQYFKIGRYFSTETKEVKQGGSINFELEVQNRGNGEDQFEIRLTNEAEAQDYGLIATFDRGVSLEPWKERTIVIRIDAQDEAIVGDITLNFTISSTGSNGAVSSSAEFTLDIEPTLIRTIFTDFWWLAIGLVALALIGALVLRRRRRRDQELIALLDIKKSKEEDEVEEAVEEEEEKEEAVEEEEAPPEDEEEEEAYELDLGGELSGIR
jgi:LPXTG-motif cell wall-anchored protein